jgi:hypothetical protein
MAAHIPELTVSPNGLSVLIGKIYASVPSHTWAELFDCLVEHTCSNRAAFLLRELKSDTSLLLGLHTNFEFPSQVLREYHERSSGC